MTEKHGNGKAIVARWSGVQPTILAFAPRTRARTLARQIVPRRRGKLLIVRTGAECLAVVKQTLVDAVLVDISAGSEDAWEIAALAPDFPSLPFIALTPLRPADAPALQRCATFEFADVLVDGVDEAVARETISPLLFSSRFAKTLGDPPAALALANDVQLAVWRMIVAHAGRPVRTAPLARALRVTREHLSRRFAAEGGPNLKRVIDLVRLIAAAELAKNPGYDTRDVSRILGFASPSHLATTVRRVVGTKPGSLSVLRAIDLIDRFVQGRERSRK